MIKNTTEKRLLSIVTEDHEYTPTMLEDFQHWLLHRGYRPETYPDASSCAIAFNLSQQFIREQQGRVVQ